MMAAIVHDKTSMMVNLSIEDSDHAGHLPSLIRVFTVCLKHQPLVTH